MIDNIRTLLGDQAPLLDYQCSGVNKDLLHLPGPDFVDRVAGRDRPQPGRAAQPAVDVRPGRLGGTGYLSILPVDQGIEHSAGASLRAQPDLLRPGEHRQAGDRGRLQRGGLDPRRAGRGVAQVRPPDPVHRQAQPQRAADLPATSTTRSCSATVEQACDMGAVAVGATIYFGSAESTRQIQEVAEAFAAGARAGHGHGPLVLPAQQRLQEGRHGLPRRRRPHRPGQPPGRHDRGRHHQAEACRRTTAATTPSNFGKTHKLVYSELCQRPPHRPDPLPGGQLLHGARGSDQLRRRLRQRTTWPRR